MLIYSMSVSVDGFNAARVSCGSVRPPPCRAG